MCFSWFNAFNNKQKLSFQTINITKRSAKQCSVCECVCMCLSVSTEGNLNSYFLLSLSLSHYFFPLVQEKWVCVCVTKASPKRRIKILKRILNHTWKLCTLFNSIFLNVISFLFFPPSVSSSLYSMFYFFNCIT